MTHEQYAEVANSGSVHGPFQPLTDTQYDPERTTIMSNDGLCDTYPLSSHRLSGEWLVQDFREYEDAQVEPLQERIHMARPIHTSRQTQTSQDETYTSHRPSKRARIRFNDFASQARQCQYQERRESRLLARKRILQRSIALSARIQRTTSWIRDGLVELTGQSDTTGFVQVFDHAQSVVDTCYSKWTNELRNLDDVQQTTNTTPTSSNQESFISRLSPAAQSQLLELVTALRSDPQFLVDRFRAFNSNQISSLWRHPSWRNAATHVTGFSSRNRYLLQFTRDLKDYCTSLERLDPLSLLIFNVYATNQSPDSRESHLRLSTWSTVCAELFMLNADAYKTLIGQIFPAFATTHDWPARSRVELFLVDHLQKGAFLLEQKDSDLGVLGPDPLNTQSAHEFFDNAIRELFSILVDCEGGFPSGALALACAILGKLSTQAQQSEFRSHVFFVWYLDYFLRGTIAHPENENMLLKVHISARARERLLGKFIDRAITKVHKVFEFPETPGDVILHNQCRHIVNFLEAKENVFDPYRTTLSTDHSKARDSFQPTIAICAVELDHLLEAFLPQPRHSVDFSSIGDSRDEFMVQQMGQAYSRQTWGAKAHFKRLQGELRELIEPGTTARDIAHPCIEVWLQLSVRDDGSLQSPTSETEVVPFFASLKGLDPVQQAVIRLCNDDEDPDGAMKGYAQGAAEALTLEQHLQQRISHCRSQAHTVDAVYWTKAQAQLKQKYPGIEVTGDETIVLRKPHEGLTAVLTQRSHNVQTLERHVNTLESSYKSFKGALDQFTSRLDQLRLKIWYSVGVTAGSGYNIAREVTTALIYMNMSRARMLSSIDKDSQSTYRPGSSRSTTSSVFTQSRDNVVELLKATTAHGGSKKLDDVQIRNIRSWMMKNEIDNFCKGEERLHRFCMEIMKLAKKLTTESTTDSPELWTSALFTREKLAYDVHALGPHSAPATSRPASVRSDSLSGTFPNLRHSPRGVDLDARSTISDTRGPLRRGSVLGMFQDKLTVSRELLDPDLLSSMGSFRGASSATTFSNRSLFSQAHSATTAASAYSRPPSLAQDLPTNRFLTASKQKREFLNQLQQGLICLLLSDLGCLVWSWGSETDTWLTNAQSNEAVASRLRKREMSDNLVVNERPRTLQVGYVQPALARKRSMSYTALDGIQEQMSKATLQDPHAVDYAAELDDILVRLSQQIDPSEKLKVVSEFHDVALQQLKMEQEAQMDKPRYERQPRPSMDTRRRSFDVKMRSSADQSEQLSNTAPNPSEEEVVRHLQKQLLHLRPRTLFRDLQYIASFTPRELLGGTTRGKVFLQVGLAALYFKSEVCKCMVAVADDITAADSVKRRTSDADEDVDIGRAAEYWKIGALNENAAAQRNLAMLYLLHPETVPIISPALTMSRDIFTDAMLWQDHYGTNYNRQALCLALYWMQQADKNGDRVAKLELLKREEREISLR